MLKPAALVAFFCVFLINLPIEARVDDLPMYKDFNGNSYEILNNWSDVRCKIFGSCFTKLFSKKRRSLEELAHYSGRLVYFKAAIECGPNYEPIFYYANGHKRTKLSAPKSSLNRYMVYADAIDHNKFLQERADFRSRFFGFKCNGNFESIEIGAYGQITDYQYLDDESGLLVDTLTIDLHKISIGRKIINELVEAGFSVLGPKSKAKAACKALEKTRIGSCRKIPYLNN